MTQLAALTAHQILCDEIHAAVLAENHHLRLHQRAPDTELLDRKRALLVRLDETLAALRAVPAASARDPETRDQLEKTRAKILQILQLDKENEQLLLRCSLTRSTGSTPTPAPSVTMLQKIYARCA
jgi:hypothetical protein